MTGPLPIGPISRPSLRHRLAVAFRFVDAFTSLPVSVPLDVRVETLAPVVGMPRLPWRAARAGDGTYRLFVTGDAVMPTGPMAVRVSAPGGEYVDAEPATVTLPRPIAGPLPTRADFLVVRPLWPTRQLALPPGETAVVGLVRTAAGAPVPRLRVRLGEPPIVGATPYAYTDGAGAFVARLPAVRALVGAPLGGTIRTAASVGIELRRPPGYTTVVAPTSPAFPLALPVGRQTTLLITVP